MINFLRGFFFLVCALLGYLLAFLLEQEEPHAVILILGSGIGMLVGVLGIGLEFILSRRLGSLIPTLFLGLFIGFFVAVVLMPMVAIPYLLVGAPKEVLGVISVFIVYLCCYIGVLVVFQNRDNFKFVIPFVEFRRERRGRRETLLDTSALIDGRVGEVLATGFLDDTVVAPDFVLHELQSIADSEDRLRRAKGRRGLDVLNRIRQLPGITVRIHEGIAAGDTVDLKLVSLAKQLDARLLTGDFNLAKLARVEGVAVINLNEVAGALRPVLLPGEEIRIRILRPGEEAHQGVGYLEDGTMVVVQGGRGHIGTEIPVLVTSVIQTHAGKMIFGRVKEALPPDPAPRPETGVAPAKG